MKSIYSLKVICVKKKHSYRADPLGLRLREPLFDRERDRDRLPLLDLDLDLEMDFDLDRLLLLEPLLREPLLDLDCDPLLREPDLDLDPFL